MTNCTSDHERCKYPPNAPTPSRAIDLRASDLFPDVRLVDYANSKGAYAALSYCWGGPQQQMLLQQKLISYYERMKESELPQIVRDTISMARSLDIRYLWVDAYCIVQDDHQDKAQEIGRMHSIFENSSLTIVAAGASTVSDKLVTLNAKDEIRKLHLMLWNGQIGTISLRPYFRNYYPRDVPVNKRAWTLQECLLSRRSLWFGNGRSTFEWHCNTLEHDEVGFFTQSRSYDYFDCGLLSRARKTHRIYSNGPYIPVHRLCDKWATIIQQYSLRSLSDPSDKLSALAGIAAVFHKMWSGVYYAGIWRQFIFQQLLWQGNPDPSEPGTFLRRPIKYRAPSWSWASVDGRLSIPAFPYIATHDIEFVSCETVLVHEQNPFGPVLRGVLRLRGLLKEASLHRASRNIFADSESSKKAADHRIGHASLDIAMSEDVLSVYCLAIERPSDDVNSETETHCSESSYDPPGQCKGLLLLPENKVKAGEHGFVRIGVFRLLAEDWFSDCVPCYLSIV